MVFFPYELVWDVLKTPLAQQSCERNLFFRPPLWLDYLLKFLIGDQLHVQYYEFKGEE